MAEPPKPKTTGTPPAGKPGGSSSAGRAEDPPPNVDPRKPPTTGHGDAPDHDKGRPKNTGRYGA